MKKPKVSVVIGAYSCEKFIQETVQSVIDQTFKDWELIVVDDHSELVDALREHWDFIKNADLSYIRTLHHWDLMAASNQPKGTLGTGTDMLNDEIVGIAAQ